MGIGLFKLVPGKTALLVVDMQKGFLQPGSVMEVPQGRELIPNIQRLINLCRDKGIPVIYTQFVYSPNVPNLIGELHPEHKRLPEGAEPGFRKPSSCCLEGDESVEIVPQLSPRPGELVVHKHGYDAFFGTNLDCALRSRGIEQLILTGVMTDICVLSTACGALHRNYRVSLVKDAVATLWPEVQRMCLDLTERAFGRVVSTGEVAEEILKIG